MKQKLLQVKNYSKNKDTKQVFFAGWEVETPAGEIQTPDDKYAEFKKKGFFIIFIENFNKQIWSRTLLFISW